jgi:lipopolysaccharide/colanic/teichoic acid biosynthesis glycosyltransferase
MRLTRASAEATEIFADGVVDSSGDGAIIRRSWDIVIALVVLVLSAPLLGAIALAIRMDSPGPAIFRQTRIGKHGREFVLYKFRGMYVDARERWPDLYEYVYSREEMQTLRFHPDADPRVTRMGRFLRRTSLDELLNFWNVLKGDMSVVGPRPEIPELMPYYGVDARLILSVKPGVTSLAKVSGRDELTFAESLAKEIEYIRGRSLRLDLKIMAATVATVVLQRGILPG